MYTLRFLFSQAFLTLYFFKLIEKVFIQQRTKAEESADQAAGLEAPLSIMIPMAVCFLAIILLGVFNTKIVDILLIALKGVAI